MLQLVARCRVCQQVRLKCGRTAELERPFTVLEWKWTDTSMDFVTGLRKGVRDFDVI